MPIAGRISTYTSGWARNQNRCCHSRALPPPLPGYASPLITRPEGMKKLVPATRSRSCITPATSSGGNASNSSRLVTSCAHTRNGMRMNCSPGARSCTMVVMMLTEPSSEELIRNTIPSSHQVWPAVSITASGG